MNKIFNKNVNEFNQILIKNGFINEMYGVINNNDLSDAVMTALKILIDSELMLNISNTGKSEHKSEDIRRAGNRLFMNNLYSEALPAFNKSLLFAPKNSESMVLAYSNRSAILLQINAIEPCLKDIDKCLSIGCSREITEKLLSRKTKYHVFMSQIRLQLLPAISPYGIEYFRFREKCNKHIPCASADITAVTENGLRKVVAAKNIECGKVVSVEPAFVLDIHEVNILISCYYCNKLTFNLNPCDGCCKALFCSNECKEKCMKEYHQIECQIINVIYAVTTTAKCRLPIRAALKIKEMSNSWQDFVSSTLEIGTCRMEKSSINEIFDVNNKLSMLNFDDNMNLIQGKIFNQSFIYAVILKYLGDIPGYFPSEEKERNEAMRAMGRVMLSLYVSFKSDLDIQNVAQNHSLHAVSSEPEPSVGLFSFASKLTHNCDPNLLPVGLNNKLALIATKFIKKGTELTISYM